MFCQWFNPLEHPSANSEIKSHSVHGLIHEGTQYETMKLIQWFNLLKTFSHDVGIIQCSVNGLIH